MSEDAYEGQGELWEELKIDRTFFSVLNSVIRSNLIAEIGPEAWAVYCVIKSHAHHVTGEAMPSLETIGERIGRSKDMIPSYLEKLYKAGLVSKSKRGRSNQYVIVESLPMTVGDEVIAYGERIYQPKHFNDFLNKLKAFSESGDVPKDRHINITLNVQMINQGDNGTVNINNYSLTPEQARALDAVSKKVRKIG
jgi:hypothetical protein